MENENNSQKGRIIAVIGAVLLLIVIGILLGLRGCEKEEPTGTPSPTPDSTVTEAVTQTTDSKSETIVTADSTDSETITEPKTESDEKTETEISVTTDANTSTEVFTETDASTVTDVPETTDAGPVTDVPETTESKTETVVPSVTDTPTQVPTKEATATPTPTKKVTATPTPTKKVTATPTPTKKVTATPTKKVTATPTPTKKVTATPTPTKKVESTATANVWEISAQKVPSSTAQTFVNKMGVGWNLGNAYDSSDCSWLGGNLHNSGDSWFGGSYEKQYRYAWCQNDWSKTLIDKIYDEGFRTIRIPVSWHNHCDENYQISSYWMSDVKRVVDYCYSKGMYVILNVHHDNNKTRGYYPSSEYQDMSEAYLKSVWTQIAKEFNGYGERLVFELLNEPRFVDASNEWWPYQSSSYKTGAGIIRDYQQIALDAIRATGGNNNSIRYILATGYAASWYALTNTGTGISYLPKDSISGHLLLSAHAYEPNDFSMNVHKTGDVNFTQTEKNKINEITKALYNTYVSKGVPVVMTEFGVIDNDNTQARADYCGYFVASARACGITCVYWDNNAFGARGSETYALISRKTNEWKFKVLADAMIANK